MTTIHVTPKESTSIPTFPDGLYRLKVTNPHLDYSRGSGSSVIGCMLNVLQGDYTGQAIPQQYSLQQEDASKSVPDATWRWKGDVRATGRLTKEIIAEDTAFDIDDAQMVELLRDMEGWAELFNEPWQGQMRTKLRSFISDDEYKKRSENPIAKPVVRVIGGVPVAGATTIAKKPF